LSAASISRPCYWQCNTVLQNRSCTRRTFGGDVSRSEFDSEAEADGFGYGDEGGETRVAVGGEGAVEAFAFDAGGFGDFGDALGLWVGGEQRDFSLRRPTTSRERGGKRNASAHSGRNDGARFGRNAGADRMSAARKKKVSTSVAKTRHECGELRSVSSSYSGYLPKAARMR